MSAISPGVTNNLPDNIEEAIRKANSTMTAANAETLRIEKDNIKAKIEYENTVAEYISGIKSLQNQKELAQESIDIKKTEMLSLDNEIAERQKELAILNIKKEDIFKKIISLDDDIKLRTKDIDDRFTSLSNKESALEVFANALSLKEDKINRYLAMIENMKSTVAR